MLRRGDSIARPSFVAKHSAAITIGLSIGFAIIFGLSLYVLPLFGNVPLLDPDEGLHAAIAQEMREHGAWIAPTFLGNPFFDKPIFFFWTQILSLSWLGADEAGIRLPGLLFGAIGALTTGLLAREIYGSRTALVAGVMQATMLGPLAQSQVAVHDVALVPCTTMALLWLHKADAAVTRRQLARALGVTAVMLGLATLTKGLAGVALVVVPTVAVLVVQRRLTFARLAALAGCVAVAAIIAAPWYVAMEQRYPGYLHYYFIERHLVGYAMGGMRHGGRPFWYYVPTLIGGAFPWGLYLWPDVRSAFTAWRARWPSWRSPDTTSPANRTAMVWTWLIAGVIFLSIAHVKMWTYALPLFPAIALLAARAWDTTFDTRIDAVRHKALEHARLLHVLLGAALLPVAAYVSHTIYASAPSTLFVICAGGIAVGYLLVLLAFRDGQAAAPPGLMFLALAALLVMTSTIALRLLMPSIANATSARDLARYFNAQGTMPPRLLVIDEHIGSLVFYLTPSLRRGLTTERVAFVPMTEARTEIDQAAPDTIIAIRERRLPQFERVMQLTRCNSQYSQDSQYSQHSPYIRTSQFRLMRADRLQACEDRRTGNQNQSGSVLIFTFLNQKVLPWS